MKTRVEKQKTTLKAKDALNRLSNGESTVNEIRSKFGLQTIPDKACDQKFTKVQ